MTLTTRTSSGVVRTPQCCTLCPRPPLTTGPALLALENALSQECHTHSDIDDVLRSYLNLINSCRGTFISPGKSSTRLPN